MNVTAKWGIRLANGLYRKMPRSRYPFLGLQTRHRLAAAAAVKTARPDIPLLPWLPCRRDCSALSARSSRSSSPSDHLSDCAEERFFVSIRRLFLSRSETVSSSYRPLGMGDMLLLARLTSIAGLRGLPSPAPDTAPRGERPDGRSD
jgi:hypothetical protein